MTKLFISYRRGDTAAHAGRLADHLKRDFGAENVFMDVNAIGPGRDFKEEIERAISTCDILLVVMHRNWARTTDATGKRRLDMESDFVRLEVAAGLSRKVRVVPVLVERAELPSVEDLGEDLRPLLRRQAYELRDERWDDDVHALSLALRGAEGRLHPSPYRKLMFGGGVFTSLVLAVVVGEKCRQAPSEEQASGSMDDGTTPELAPRDAAPLPPEPRKLSPPADESDTRKHGPRGKHCTVNGTGLSLFAFEDAQEQRWFPLDQPGTAHVQTVEGGCAGTRAMEIAVPRADGFDGNGAMVDYNGPSWTRRTRLHLQMHVPSDIQAFDFQVFVKSYHDSVCECSWWRGNQDLRPGEWADIHFQLSDCPESKRGTCLRPEDVKGMGIKVFKNASPIRLLVDQIWVE